MLKLGDYRGVSVFIEEVAVLPHSRQQPEGNEGRLIRIVKDSGICFTWDDFVKMRCCADDLASLLFHRQALICRLLYKESGELFFRRKDESLENGTICLEYRVFLRP